MIDHLPSPHDSNLERSLLCGCMLYPDHREAAVDILKPNDFYPVAHQHAFAAIQAIHRRQEPVDMPQVASELRKAGKLEFCGGVTGLAALIDDSPTTDPNHAAKKVKGFSIQRSLIAACTRIIDKAQRAEGDPSEILDEAQASILAVDTTAAAESALRSMEEITVESLQRYERMNRREGRDGIKTGFFELDALTGGFKGSKLIIIAARPGVGKTSFMLCIARNMAKVGHKVTIFSLEMDAEELDDRLTAMETGINTVALSTGTGPKKSQWEQIHAAAKRKAEWPIQIDDTGGLHIGELRRRCRRARKQGTEVIFIDQLSKIRGGEGKSEYEKRSSIVNDLACLKKELRIPIVLLAQVNRGAENRIDKRPTLSDLKSTGSLEEDADMVLLGHRPWIYTRNPGDESKSTWELAKHRGGPTRIIYMNWHPKTTNFSDVKTP